MKTKSICLILSLSLGLFLLTLSLTIFNDSLPFLKAMGSELFSQNQWNYRFNQYSAMSMISGTLSVAFLALAFSLPLALGTAIYISEYFSGKRRAFIKVSIELLAGIPSVVYGLLGVVFLRNWIFPFIEPFGAASGDSIFTASLLLAIMILPTLMTLSDDALRCVPKSIRISGVALGLTRSQVILHNVLPQAFPGLVSATLLALGRALGETIAVYLVVGRSDLIRSKSIPFLEGMFLSGQTLSTKLGSSEISIAFGDPIHWGALMSLALILWFLVIMVNSIGRYLYSFGDLENV